MKLEDQVVSLEYAKRLKELGVKQEGLFHWVENFRGIELCGEGNLNIEWSIHPSSNRGNWSAFTVAELGEMLPLYIVSRRLYDNWEFTVTLDKDPYTIEYETYDELSQVNAYAALLIYLLENKLIPLP
jgi:hypothetical protein